MNTICTANQPQHASSRMPHGRVCGDSATCAGAGGRHTCGMRVAGLETTRNSITITAPDALHIELKKLTRHTTEQGTAQRPQSQANKFNRTGVGRYASTAAAEQAPQCRSTFTVGIALPCPRSKRGRWKQHSTYIQWGRTRRTQGARKEKRPGIEKPGNW